MPSAAAAVRSMGNKAHPRKKASRSDASPSVGAVALGGVCHRRWNQVLATDCPVPQSPAGRPNQDRTLQAGTREGLAKDHNIEFTQPRIINPLKKR